MAWIKKEETAQINKELEYSNNISKTNAYEVEITECRVAESKDTSSKSLSLIVGVKTKDGETGKSMFTLAGRDGKTYYETTVAGNKVKKQHIGLGIANTLFKIVLNKEIFDCEPSEIQYEFYNKDTKEKDVLSGDGFPEIVGKTVGVCVQMVRTIDGKDSYEKGEIEHFFNNETGLFCDEEDSSNRKLDRWLNKAKDFKEIVKEAPKSAFGNKAEDEAPKKKWGK